MSATRSEKQFRTGLVVLILEAPMPRPQASFIRGQFKFHARVDGSRGNKTVRHPPLIIFNCKDQAAWHYIAMFMFSFRCKHRFCQCLLYSSSFIQYLRIRNDAARVAQTELSIQTLNAQIHR